MPLHAVGVGVFGVAALARRWRRVGGTHEGVERALEAAEERHSSSAAADPPMGWYGNPTDDKYSTFCAFCFVFFSLVLAPPPTGGEYEREE